MLEANLDLGPDDAMQACRDAVATLGWHIIKQDAEKIVVADEKKKLPFTQALANTIEVTVVTPPRTSLVWGTRLGEWSIVQLVGLGQASASVGGMLIAFKTAVELAGSKIQQANKLRKRAADTKEVGSAVRRVFISYRREDCQAQANGLNDGLRERMQQAEVFMDLDSIPPGSDFEEFIRTWIAGSDVVLVLIGDNWLSRDDHGERRLDDPQDFVRLEVRAALEQGTTIIPVLVEGAAMPTSSDLPKDIGHLSRIQYGELSDQRWRSDLERLAEAIRTVKP